MYHHSQIICISGLVQWKPHTNISPYIGGGDAYATNRPRIFHQNSNLCAGAGVVARRYGIKILIMFRVF